MAALDIWHSFLPQSNAARATDAPGCIHLVMGPMFSGKTSMLTRLVQLYELAGDNCLVVKYAKDTRYSDAQLATHDKRLTPAFSASVLADVGAAWRDVDVVAVDEGQFFPDLLPFCTTAAAAGKIVLVAALDGTFQRQPFGSVCDLVAVADRVAKLSAVCQFCGEEAAFSRRLTSDTAVELIGGAESYVPVDRTCFHRSVLPERGVAPLLTPSLRPRLELVLGPVKCGKTSELHRLVRRYQLAFRKCVVVNHSSVDATYPDDFVAVRRCDALTDVASDLASFDVVAVDQAQLFSDLLLVDDLANDGKVVLVAALDGTFTQKPYGAACDLIPRCDKVTKMPGVCAWCRGEACFSRQLLPGGEYKPCCRGCLSLPLPSTPEHRTRTCVGAVSGVSSMSASTASPPTSETDGHSGSSPSSGDEGDDECGSGDGARAGAGVSVLDMSTSSASSLPVTPIV